MNLKLKKQQQQQQQQQKKEQIILCSPTHLLPIFVHYKYNYTWRHFLFYYHYFIYFLNDVFVRV